MNTVKKSTEKYHLWHTAIVKGVDLEKRSCVAKLEQNIKTGDKRKSASDQYHVLFEEIFPLSSEFMFCDLESIKTAWYFLGIICFLYED